MANITSILESNNISTVFRFKKDAKDAILTILFTNDEIEIK